MVKKWMKQLSILWKNTNVDFDSIVYDILSGNYAKHDYKSLAWYNDVFRIRIWWYRIVFSVKNNDIRILLLWNRWDVYKQLRKMFY